MHKSIVTSFFLVIFFSNSFAQPARFQLIHSAPENAVDVYINGVLAVDNFVYRSAQPFIDLPPGVPVAVAIAPANSNSAAQAFFTKNLQFAPGRAYTATTVGIQGGTPAFDLTVDENAQENALDPSKTDISLINGNAGPQAFDLVVRLGEHVADAVGFGKYGKYKSVKAEEYFVDVRLAGTQTIAGTYRLNLTGLTGKAARLLFSGRLGGTPAPGLYIVAGDGQVTPALAEGVACVQFINNAPNSILDVYKNGNRFIDDAPFRAAMPFKIVPAGLPMNIVVAAGASANANQPLYQTTYTFENGKAYYVTTTGIEGNAATPLTLHINPNGRLEPLDTNTVEFSLFHGAAGVSALDVDLVLVKPHFASNLGYGQATGLAAYTPGKFDFALRPAGNPTPLETFRADLSALKKKTAYVFAGGVPGGNPAFGLFAALTDGTVLSLPVTPFAKIQIVHNAPEPAVDVYADSTRIADDMAFRTARPYLSVPADRPVRLSFGGAGAASVSDAFLPFGFSFAAGQLYTVLSTGVVFGNPAFNVVSAPAREHAATPDKVDLSFFHGIPNAPAIDIGVFLGDNAVSALDYEKFSPYAPFNPDTFYFQIKPAGSGTVAGTFRADLRPYAGKAIRVFASGYLNGVPALGLSGVLSDGTVVAFPVAQPPATMARIQLIHNSASAAVDVYAGAIKVKDDLAYRSATSFFEVPGGVATAIAVAPGNSASAAAALDTLQFKFIAGKSYVILAHGLAGDAGTPFKLTLREAKSQAEFSFGLDVTLFHGAANAPAVDLESVFVGSLFNGLAYGQFSPYLGVNPGINDWAVKQKDSSKVLATYRADFTKQIGQAVTVFASGIVGGTPAFGLFVAYADGRVAALPPMPVTRVQLIHNTSDPSIDLYAGTKFILNDLPYRSATRFIEFPADRPIQFGVAGNASTSSADVVFKTFATFSSGKLYTAVLSGIPFDTVTPVVMFLQENAREKSQDNNVELNFFHGAPGLPEIDLVRLPNTPVFFDNLAYGKFSSNYVSVPPAQYQLALTPFDNNGKIFKSYRANLGAYGGQALTLFASGLPDGQPALGLWAATPDGITFPLEEFVKTGELEEKITRFRVSPNPASAVVALQLDLKEPAVLRYQIRDLNGRTVQTGGLGRVDAGAFVQNIEIGNLTNGLYLLEIRSEKGVRVEKLAVQR